MGDSNSIRPGGRFDDLEIEAAIGAGAFGTVYRARDPMVGRTVALKVIRPAGFAPVTEEFERRFLREVRALGSLVHPNIAALYDVHKLDDGGWALELEFVDGPSIDALIGRNTRLSPSEATSIARGIASGLRAAHEARVVHGDVKPANVLRTKAGVIKIVDFGLARTMATESAMSSSGRLSGTPHYLAPEIVEGGKHTPAGDVWGFGALLYRALSGRLPFDAETLPGLFFRVLNTDVAPLPDDIPEAMRKLVIACLSKRPEDRPPIDDRFFAGLDLRKTSREAPVAVAERVESRRQDLIGREPELGQLNEALSRAAAGSTEIVALTGAAGIGKTRLTAALEHDARARGMRAIRVIVTATEGLLRPLHRALVAEDPEAGKHAGASADTRSPKAPVANLADVERRLTALAAERAVLLVIEDFHRASAEDVRMLARLAARMDEGRVLFLVTERAPDLDATVGAAPRYEALLGEKGRRIDLGPLSREALHRLLAETALGEAAPELADRAVVRSGGNPLFAIHLLSHALEARAEHKRKGIESKTAATTLEPPPMLRDLMVRRLRGMPENLREVLDAAAVEGATFDAEALARALGHEPIDVLRRLQRISRSPGLVVPLEHGYRFAHPLLQETVYAEVAPDLRRALHRSYAFDLESRGDEVDPEQLGTHWERANEPQRAAPHLLKAAAKAGNRLEYWRCADLTTRAGVGMRSMGVEFVRAHLEDLFAVAGVMSEIGRPADRDAIMDDVARTAETLGDAVLAYRVTARRGLSRILGSGLADGDEARIVEASRELPDSIDRGVAFYALGLIEKYRGSLAAAEAAFVRADECFVRFDAPGRHGSALDQLAAIDALVGRSSRAAMRYQEAASVCRAAGRFGNAEISEVNAVLVDIEAGRIDGAVERLDRSARVLDAEGGTVPAARIRVMLARLRFAFGELTAARGLAARAVEALRRIGMKAGIAKACAIVADLAIAAGDAQSAADHIAEGREAARALGNRTDILRFEFQDALLATTQRQPEIAERLASRALDSLTPDERSLIDIDAVMPLLDASVLGLSPSLGRSLIESTIASAPAESALGRTARALSDGLDAAGAADAGGLERAATSLLRADVGLRRAQLHVIGRTWTAMAARTRGNDADARRLAAQAVESAEALAHLPLKSWVLFVVSPIAVNPR